MYAEEDLSWDATTIFNTIFNSPGNFYSQREEREENMRKSSFENHSNKYRNRVHFPSRIVWVVFYHMHNSLCYRSRIVSLIICQSLPNRHRLFPESQRLIPLRDFTRPSCRRKWLLCRRISLTVNMTDMERLGRHSSTIHPNLWINGKTRQIWYTELLVRRD